MLYEVSPSINEAYLHEKGRNILKRIKKMFSFYVSKVTICSKDFDILLKSVNKSFQKDCKNEILYKGKSIFRGK
jgi:hypothetical protein